MAEIIITVPDGTITRIVNGMCAAQDYDRNKLDGETKAEFAKRMTKNYWKRIVIESEAHAAAKAAAEAIRTAPGDALVSDPD